MLRSGQTLTKLPSFQPVIKDLNKSTMTVTIGMDKRTVSIITHRTDEYKALPQKLKPAMEGIADYVRGSMVPKTFSKEGPGWKKLSKRTVRERTKLGYGGQHPILIRLRDLYKELTDKAHPKHIEIIKVGKKARIEIGGSSQKFIDNQLGKRSQNLPSRPMIPGTGSLRLLDRDRMQMSKIIETAYRNSILRPQ